MYMCRGPVSQFSRSAIRVIDHLSRYMANKRCIILIYITVYTSTNLLPSLTPSHGILALAVRVQMSAANNNYGFGTFTIVEFYRGAYENLLTSMYDFREPPGTLILDCSLKYTNRSRLKHMESNMSRTVLIIESVYISNFKTVLSEIPYPSTNPRV